MNSSKRDAWMNPGDKSLIELSRIVSVHRKSSICKQTDRGTLRASQSSF